TLLGKISPARQGSFTSCTAQYDGTKDTEVLEAFLAAINIFKRIENISDEEALSSVPLLLKGEAAIWWQGVKNHVATWESFGDRLRHTFAPKKPAFVLYQEIVGTRQTNATATENFVANKRMLISQLPAPEPTESHQLDMIYGSLRPKIQDKIPRCSFKTFDELITISRAIERLWSERVKEAKNPTQRPTKSWQPQKKCGFHHFSGHNTEECRKLKKKQEEQGVKVEAPEAPAHPRIERSRATQMPSPSTPSIQCYVKFVMYVMYFYLDTEKVQVCKTFFINTLSISHQTVYTALEKIKSDKGLIENRGCHNTRPRKMSLETEENIKEHIQLFPAVESHYTRKNSARQYLSELLNISKMYRLYEAWFAEGHYSCRMASKRQYETIFNTRFNYSFHRPKKDQCGQCALYRQADPVTEETMREKFNQHQKNKERKYTVKEMTQNEYKDIKELIKNKNWAKDEEGQKVAWSKIMEISVLHSQPTVLRFKYDYDADYSRLNVEPLPRTAPRNKRAYNKPLPISKALHGDLMSLCRAGAIPNYYHGFYNSLTFTNCSEELNHEDSDEVHED
ncbi:hypothetical protein SFRURICE_014074, partial [Spodoptera frugiperda]